MDWEKLLFLMLESVLFTVVGLIFFTLAWVIIERFTPFSIRKEIEEDQNIALAIVLAAVILGIALIVAAPLRG
jgi:uncharacterized membrane protein YjfL (UPF0719 family)